VEQKFPAGSSIEGPVTSITKFGAFVQLVEGIEGMVHVSEITAERHLNHPQDVLRLGQVVKAQVLEVDTAKRQIKLSMKQRANVSLDEYLADHAMGSVVTGRIVDVSDGVARVELGDGIQGSCLLARTPVAAEAAPVAGQVDLSALSSMLKARWKSGPSSSSVAKPEAVQAGQIRSFRVGEVVADSKQIVLEMV
jgi:small subunit ribosomal protein S1